MGSKTRLVRKCRRYSDDFKRKLVSEFESGRYSVLQMEKVYGVGNPLIYKWIYQFSDLNQKGYRVVEHVDSGEEKMKKLEARVKLLEQTLGKKQITIDYLEKLIEVAGDELSMDLEKNFGTLRSDGSLPTSRK